MSITCRVAWRPGLPAGRDVGVGVARTGGDSQSGRADGYSRRPHGTHQKAAFTQRGADAHGFIRVADRDRDDVAGGITGRRPTQRGQASPEASSHRAHSHATLRFRPRDA